MLPEAKWQHCIVHLVKKILRNVRTEGQQTLGDELKEIWYTSNKQEALRWSRKIYNKYNRKYPKAMNRLKYGIRDTLTFLDFPEYSPKKSQPQTYLNDSIRNFSDVASLSEFSRTFRHARRYIHFICYQIRGQMGGIPSEIKTIPVTF